MKIKIYKGVLVMKGVGNNFQKKLTLLEKIKTTKEPILIADKDNEYQALVKEIQATHKNIIYLN